MAKNIGKDRGLLSETLRDLIFEQICIFLHKINIINVKNIILWLNLLKPTGHVMHQQFNIQQLYVLPTLYLRVLYLSENKQRLVPLTA
jgi:hypothetical protein